MTVGSGVGVNVGAVVGVFVAVGVFGCVGTGVLVARGALDVGRDASVCSLAPALAAQPLTSKANKINKRKGKYTFVIVGTILLESDRYRVLAAG